MIAPTENLLEYKIVERNMAHLFYLGSSGLASIRPAMWPSRFSWREKKFNKYYFFKNHSALTVAPTENLLEYKIVDRKMTHLFYLSKVCQALLV